MLTPGPDHPITVEPARARWRAAYTNQILADSAHAVVLQEANYPPVVYFPREDVGMEFLGKTERATHCPYKGQASYFTITRNGKVAENAAWSYEAPFDAVAPIAGMIAFYTDRVEVYPVDEAVVNPAHHRDASVAHPGRAKPGVDDGEFGGPAEGADVDEVVQHTDDGSGRSQREHWPANVDMPRGEDGGLR